MLTKEEIVENYKKYVSTGQKNGFLTDGLLEFLGPDLLKAPASTMKSLINAYEGGLIEYLMQVTNYGIMINNALPESERADRNSLLKVCLLHQIGKAKLYKPCTSEWHKNNLGKMYEFNEDLVSMRVGERSVYYATQYGVSLTEDEMIAIINHDKPEDKMSEYHNSLVGDILKSAIVFASKHLKK